MASYRDHLDSLINAGDHLRTESTSRPEAVNEPVSILHGAIGLIADSIQIQADLKSLEDGSGEGKMALDALRSALKSFKPTVQVAYKTLRQVEQGSIANPDRCELINIEIITVTLTQSILVMSEIGTLLMEMTAPSDDTGAGVAIGAEQAKALKRHTYRLRKADCILSKMPSVLMVSDKDEARRQQGQIQEKVIELMQSNPLLLDRFLQIKVPTSIESDASSQTLAGDTPPQYTPSPDRNRDSGVSIDSDDVNSVFSGMTLADVSNLSTATLPITPAEVKQSILYASGYCHSVREALDVALELNVKNKSQAIARALGLGDAGSKVTLVNSTMPPYPSDVQRAPNVLGVRVAAYADHIWTNVCEPARQSRSRQG